MKDFFVRILARLRELFPGKKTYVLFGSLFVVWALKQFLHVDLTPLLVVLGIDHTQLGGDLLLLFDTLTQGVVGAVAFLGVLLRLLTKSDFNAPWTKLSGDETHVIYVTSDEEFEHLMQVIDESMD